MEAFRSELVNRALIVHEYNSIKFCIKQKSILIFIFTIYQNYPLALKVLGKSVGLCKTSKRKDQLYISVLVSVWESSVKISTQTDSY